MENIISDFPMQRSAPLLPPPELLRRQANEPVSQIRLKSGQVVWLVTRYQDVRSLMVDPRISKDAATPNFPAIGPSGMNPNLRTFTHKDGAEHTAGRRMLAKEFSAESVNALQPKVREIVRGLLDAMLARTGPVDFVEAVALPLPSLLICGILGVPYEDHDLFQGFETAVMSLDPQESALGAKQEMEYLQEMVAKKQREPGDDLVSRLIRDEVSRGTMSPQDLARVMRALLSAGHESTANMTSLSILSLLLDPDAFEALRRDPESIPAAVNEFLRFHSVFHTFSPRVAKVDIEIGGRVIRAGDGVVLSVLGANHDAAAFPDPQKIDLTRDARAHVGFGFGAHNCMGQGLARMELREVIGMVLERIPTLQLAVPFEQLRFREDRSTYGVYELPVKW